MTGPGPKYETDGEGNPIERLIVFTFSCQDFSHWCQDNSINRRSSNVRYALDGRCARGINGWRPVLAGREPLWPGWRYDFHRLRDIYLSQTDQNSPPGTTTLAPPESG